MSSCLVFNKKHAVYPKRQYSVHRTFYFNSKQIPGEYNIEMPLVNACFHHVYIALGVVFVFLLFD